MKRVILMTCLLVCSLLHGQIKFSHEREIKGKENYNHYELDFLTSQTSYAYLEH